MLFEWVYRLDDPKNSDVLHVCNDHTIVIKMSKG